MMKASPINPTKLIESLKHALILIVSDYLLQGKLTSLFLPLGHLSGISFKEYFYPMAEPTI
jgi:hypothetical protein